MAEDDFKNLYEELYRRPLAEPRNEQEVKDVLSCVRAKLGFFDAEEEDELRSTTPALQMKLAMLTKDSRKLLADFTKT